MTKPPNETVPSFRHMTEAELVRFALSDDYEILEEIGRGGMAIVYRAREKTLDREVAIKVLPARLVIDQGFVDRFEHEARTAAKLEHPNIVPIYRVGRAGPGGEVIYFVMKLLRGQSLSAVLNERIKLEASDVRRILMETAAALGYAAKRSVVHRDIKPDNIMLDSEGRCVLTDFGIAKAPGGQQTTAGTSLGTPRYMSPEHAMGLPLDGRSDMYSLGVVAYQCLVGSPPYEAPEPFAVLYKHIHEPVPTPTLETEEERQLFTVIERMLAKKPDDRYQDGNELIAALGGQLSDPSLAASMITTAPGLMAPTEVMPTPKPWSMSRWRMLSRTRQLVWSGVAVAVIATGLAFALNSADATPPDAGDGGARLAGAPPLVSGPVVSRLSAADSAALARPKLSQRVVTILGYNRARSSCAQRDTAESSPPIAYAVLMDSIADRPQGDSLSIAYDVCGLDRNAPFTTTFKLSKLRQRSPGFMQQKPLEVNTLETAAHPRSRERYVLGVAQMSPGSYRLEMRVVDKRQRQTTASREFQILEKKP